MPSSSQLEAAVLSTAVPEISDRETEYWVCIAPIDYFAFIYK